MDRKYLSAILMVTFFVSESWAQRPPRNGGSQNPRPGQGRPNGDRPNGSGQNGNRPNGGGQFGNRPNGGAQGGGGVRTGVKVPNSPRYQNYRNQGRNRNDLNSIICGDLRQTDKDSYITCTDAVTAAENMTGKYAIPAGKYLGCVQGMHLGMRNGVRDGKAPQNFHYYMDFYRNELSTADFPTVTRNVSADATNQGLVAGYDEVISIHKRAVQGFDLPTAPRGKTFILTKNIDGFAADRPALPHADIPYTNARNDDFYMKTYLAKRDISRRCFFDAKVFRENRRAYDPWTIYSRGHEDAIYVNDWSDPQFIWGKFLYERGLNQAYFSIPEVEGEVPHPQRAVFESRFRSAYAEVSQPTFKVNFDTEFRESYYEGDQFGYDIGLMIAENTAFIDAYQEQYMRRAKEVFSRIASNSYEDAFYELHDEFGQRAVLEFNRMSLVEEISDSIFTPAEKFKISYDISNLGRVQGSSQLQLDPSFSILRQSTQNIMFEPLTRHEGVTENFLGEISSSTFAGDELVVSAILQGNTRSDLRISSSRNLDIIVHERVEVKSIRPSSLNLFEGIMQVDIDLKNPSTQESLISELVLEGHNQFWTLNIPELRGKENYVATFTLTNLDPLLSFKSPQNVGFSGRTYLKVGGARRKVFSIEQITSMDEKDFFAEYYMGLIAGKKYSTGDEGKEARLKKLEDRIFSFVSAEIAKKGLNWANNREFRGTIVSKLVDQKNALRISILKSPSGLKRLKSLQARLKGLQNSSQFNGTKRDRKKFGERLDALGAI